jgi:predicted O-linked N-acetylglucosamine transferase (SPINDLY family)
MLHLFRRVKQGSSVAHVVRVIEEGNRLEDAGEWHAALECYRRAAAIAPMYARSHINIGNAYRLMGRIDEALYAYRVAVRCEPSNAGAHFNLGALLVEHGDPVQAEGALLEAIRLDSAMPHAPVVLADLYETLSRFDEAEAQLRRAAGASPAHPGVLLNLGMLCYRRGRVDEALCWLAKAKEADPGLTDAESSLLFSLNFRSDLTAEEIATRHFEMGKAITRNAGMPIAKWRNTKDADRPLRVAYVSGDFVFHPITIFLKPILEHHDRSAFTAYCYSNHPKSHAAADELKSRCDGWRDVSDLDDGAFVDLVQNDAIDLLIDLSGHTNRNRLSAFVRHPAPVQITWLGYLNTTGISATDYRICDRFTDPEGASEHLHVERLLRMPNSQWCYTPWIELPRIETPHPDRPDALVFGSFNQLAKVTDATLNAWCMILRSLPTSELLVMDVRTPSTRDNLLRRIAERGVDPARVRTQARTSIEDYLRRVGNCDISLDTFPYSGATTTLDALWMDVPVVGLRGERGVSRSAFSILRSLRLDELIAGDWDDYVETNVRLAMDRAWRQTLRRNLRQKLECSPLMDAAVFVRDLEALYRSAWRKWCET